MRTSFAAVSALSLLLGSACDSTTPTPAPTHEPESVPESSVDEIASEPSAPSEPEPAVPACDPLSPRTQPLVLDVLPEAGPRPFVSVLESATTSIRVMVYQMGFGPILDALEAKAKAGIEVRVILDVAQKNVNEKYKARLEAAGAKVIWSDTRFQYMHAKVIVVDDARAVLSTGNYYIARMQTERNFAVTDTDPADVKVLTQIFDADYAGADPVVDCTRLLVSPNNAKERLIAFIASAQKSLLVESMRFADSDVRAAVLARKAAGVDVRVILADPSWIDANEGAAKVLVASEVPARYLKDPGMHAKAIVADGSRAYVGSINLSYTSLTKNREVGLIVTEPANIAAMETTFATDWAKATAF